MDPVTVGAVLAAIAGGAGGALGSPLGAGVCALIRRPFGHVRPVQDAEGSEESGEVQLAALEQVPDDRSRAVALAEMLLTRAGEHIDFAQALSAWWAQAGQIQVVSGEVRNIVRDGTFYGPVVQGRDFSGLTFGSGAQRTPERDS